MHAEQAIERYGPLVMSLIWRIKGNHDETADLYQEVFVKFHETTSQRGPLQQPKAWLCRTAINAALDFKRQRSRFVSWTESAEQPHNWEADDVDVVEIWSYGRKDSPSHGGFARAPQRSLRPPLLPRLFLRTDRPTAKLLCRSSACRSVPSRKTDSRVAHLRLSIRNDIKPQGS